MDSGVTLFGLTGNCFVSNEVFKKYFDSTWQSLQQNNILKAKVTVENQSFNLVFSLSSKEECDFPLSVEEFKMFLENEVNRALIEDQSDDGIPEETDLNLISEPFMWDILDHTEEVGIPYRLGCDIISTEESISDEEY